jgi:hypothetical protein
MRDLLVLMMTVGFFGLCVGYVGLCDRIVGSDDAESGAVADEQDEPVSSVDVTR